MAAGEVGEDDGSDDLVAVLQTHSRLICLKQRQGLVTREQDLTRLPSKLHLRWLRTRKTSAYQGSSCMNLSVSCPYEIIVYSVLKRINTTRMHTIS